MRKEEYVGPAAARTRRWACDASSFNKIQMNAMRQQPHLQMRSQTNKQTNILFLIVPQIVCVRWPMLPQILIGGGTD